jgi:hypothetical protein
LVFTLNQGHGQHISLGNKPRIIITADSELDDENSLIRFLLYSKEMSIEGLIYAISGVNWKGDGSGKKWFCFENDLGNYPFL